MVLCVWWVGGGGGGELDTLCPLPRVVVLRCSLGQWLPFAVSCCRCLVAYGLFWAGAPWGFASGDFRGPIGVAPVVAVFQLGPVLSGVFILLSMCLALIPSAFSTGFFRDSFRIWF